MPAASRGCSVRNMRNAESWERCFSRLQSLQFKGFLSRRLWIPLDLTQRKGKISPVLMWLTKELGKAKGFSVSQAQARITPGTDNAHDNWNLSSAALTDLTPPAKHIP